MKVGLWIIHFTYGILMLTSSSTGGGGGGRSNLLILRSIAFATPEEDLAFFPMLMRCSCCFCYCCCCESSSVADDIGVSLVRSFVKCCCCLVIYSKQMCQQNQLEQKFKPTPPSACLVSSQPDIQFGACGRAFLLRYWVSPRALNNKKDVLCWLCTSTWRFVR